MTQAIQSDVSCQNCEACCCRLEVMLFTDTGVPDRYIEEREGEVPVMHRLEDGWCATHGCAFLAVVMIGDFKRYLADHVFSELPFQEVRYFEEEAQAIHWLTQRLEGLQGKEIHVSTG